MMTQIKKSALLSALLFFLITGSAICAQNYYYSIHLDSFRTLEDANRKANILKDRGEVVFLLKTEIPGEGKLYKLFLGKFETEEDAVTRWEKLSKRKEVTHFSIQLFDRQPTSDSKNKSVKTRPAIKSEPVVPSFGISPKERFVDNQDGTITDRQTGLMWIKNGWKLGFIKAISWFDAVAKVKKFRHGNYTDWRLPSISEWSGLIDTRHRNPAIVASPFENIISHMPYWSQTDFTYALEQPGVYDSYVVILYAGNIAHQKKSERGFVLPVRTVSSQNVTLK